MIKNIIEKENDIHLAELGQYVSLLKNNTLEIYNEIDYQNKLLNNIQQKINNINFDLFIYKIKNIYKNNNYKNQYTYFYLILFSFLFLYFILS